MFDILAKKKISNKGFTLIEIIIALAILGIISISFLTLFTNGYTSIFRSGRNSQALFVAQEDIENKIFTGTSAEDVDLIMDFGTIDITVKGKKDIGQGSSGTQTRELSAFLAKDSISTLIPSGGSDSDDDSDDTLIGELEVALENITTLSFDASYPSTHETPKLVAPLEVNDISYKFTLSAADSPSKIEILDAGNTAKITRPSGSSKLGTITLTASKSGVTSSKTYNVIIPSGIGAVTIHPQ